MEILPSLLVFAGSAFAGTQELGNGFLHHGVATPVSNHRGTVATVDGEGRNVVLVWLFDHRGGYAIMIDAETGESKEYPTPFAPGGDCPYASLLSTGNKFYTHFNSYFVEFDPEKRDFTFYSKTAPQMAMGMTEDDEGVIWSVTYPQSGVVSFDPETREFKDYGHVYKQNWAQYQRYVATDDMGWLYFGIGSTASQIIAFNPQTETAIPLISENERVKGSGYVFGITNSQQGPRVFILSPDKQIYMLFVKSIARIDLESFEIIQLAESPVAIGPGGDILDGQIFFGSGSHLYSYKIGEH